MAIKTENLDLSSAYIGNTELSKIYKGSSEIWTSSSVVQDNLVLYLDASEYSGSGTSWTDLSSSNATAAFNLDMSSNYGTYGGVSNALNFVTNKYVTVSNNNAFNFSAAQSIYILSYPLSNGNRQNYWDQAYGGEGTWTREGNSTMNYFFGTSGGNAQSYDGYNSGTSVTLNAWQSWCFTRDASTTHWYKNGAQTAAKNVVYGPPPNTTQNIRIGLGYTGQYLSAYMLAVVAYNRKLTQAEIQANDDYFNNKYGLSL